MKEWGKHKLVKSSGGVEAVDRALAIMSAFQKLDHALTLTEITRRTGLYGSTALRLLASLERAGYVRRRRDKSYVLGAEPLRLSAIYQRTFNLEDHVRPIVRDLMKSTGESASLFCPVGNERILLVRENTDRRIRDYAIEGDTFPLHRGAAGRILARFQNIQSDAIPGNLQRELPFVSMGEIDKDMAGIAMPVFDQTNTMMGALALTGPINRFSPDSVSKFSNQLIEAARKMSSSLGAAIHPGGGKPASRTGRLT